VANPAIFLVIDMLIKKHECEKTNRIGVLQACAPSLDRSQPTTSSKGNAKTQLELLLKEIENLQDAIQSSEHDPDSMFFRLLRAGVVEALQRVQAAQAKELLPATVSTPFVPRDDGHGFSLKRLKPFHEIGPRKGNRSKRAAVSVQENSQPLAEPFLRPPAANKPHTMIEILEASNSRAKRQKAAPLQGISTNVRTTSPDHGSLQPLATNATPSVQAHPFTASAHCNVPPSTSSIQVVHTPLPTLSSMGTGAPGHSHAQLQPPEPTCLAQSRALQPIRNPCKAILHATDARLSVEVQAGAPNVVQPATTTLSSEAQVMPAPSHQYPPPIFYPFLQVPINLSAWGLLSQQDPLTPRTRLNQQLSQWNQQAAATASKVSSDSNPFHQQVYQA